MARPSLVVALMVRNEADRYLRSALSAWSDFADEIVALDDGSTDATPDLLAEFGCDVIRWTGDRAWGAEASPRAALWNAAVETGADYIMALDADMVPMRSPKPLLAGGVDGVLFGLFDLWSLDPLTYRDDHHWQGHRHPRLWLTRRGEKVDGPWTDRGLHVGHFPPSLKLERVLWAPIEYAILHYGYADPEDRQVKAQQYLDKQDVLMSHEIAHALSITDPEPRTMPLTHPIKWPLTRGRI